MKNAVNQVNQVNRGLEFAFPFPMTSREGRKHDDGFNQT